MKKLFAAALVLSALALPCEARSETKAALLLSGSGATPARNDYSSEFFDGSGNLRTFSGMDYDLGLGYQISDNVHFSAGSFRNSRDGQTHYAGIGVEADLAPEITAGVEVGGLMTYTEDPREQGEFSPTAIPYVRFGAEDEMNLKFLAIPPAGDVSPGVVGFRLTVPFKPE